MAYCAAIRRIWSAGIEGDRMALLNSAGRYGAVAKLFHWTVFLIFVNQYVTGSVMMRLGKGQAFLGYSGVVLLRIVWRKTTPLPDWAETLEDWERAVTKWVERVLYTFMILMPVSGYVFTMAGGYNFKLFGLVKLPVLIEKNASLAAVGEWSHLIIGYMIVIALTLHIGLGLKHHLVNKDRFLNRMLPFTKQ
jgi:cytochrome b561